MSERAGPGGVYAPADGAEGSRIICTHSIEPFVWPPGVSRVKVWMVQNAAFS